LNGGPFAWPLALAKVRLVRLVPNCDFGTITLVGSRSKAEVNELVAQAAEVKLNLGQIDALAMALIITTSTA
jgi:hypothetical protein